MNRCQLSMICNSYRCLSYAEAVKLTGQDITNFAEYDTEYEFVFHSIYVRTAVRFSTPSYHLEKGKKTQMT